MDQRLIIALPVQMALMPSVASIPAEGPLDRADSFHTSFTTTCIPSQIRFISSKLFANFTVPFPRVRFPFELGCFSSLEIVFREALGVNCNLVGMIHESISDKSLSVSAASIEDVVGLGLEPDITNAPVAIQQLYLHIAVQAK